VENISNIFKYVKDKTQRVIILPLWDVNKFVYTDKHNKNAREINTLLKKEYKQDFFESEIFISNEYKKYYNYDSFHFKNTFHEKLSQELIAYLKENEK